MKSASHKFSYWEHKYWYEGVYDYVVVGSGYVGLSTAIHIQSEKPDSRILIMEKSPLPHGASTKNAGFVCFGSVGELIDDLNHITEKEVIETVRMRWEGLRYMLDFIDPQVINYSNQGGTEVFRSKEKYESAEQHIAYINSLLKDVVGQDVFSVKQLTGTRFHNYAIHNPLEGQLNPVLLLKTLVQKALKLGIRISYSMPVNDYNSHNNHVQIFSTDNLVIKTRNLIFCNNAFARDVVPDSIIPARNQVVVTKPIPNMQLRGTYHLDRGYVYFRNLGDDRILIGGARNIVGQAELTDVMGTNEIIISHLKEILEQEIIGRDVDIEYKWSGIIATGESKRPIIRQISKGVYTGVRLGGMGVAIGIQVGRKLAKLVLE